MLRECLDVNLLGYIRVVNSIFHHQQTEVSEIIIICRNANCTIIGLDPVTRRAPSLNNLLGDMICSIGVIFAVHV